MPISLEEFADRPGVADEKETTDLLKIVTIDWLIKDALEAEEDEDNLISIRCLKRLTERGSYMEHAVKELLGIPVLKEFAKSVNPSVRLLTCQLMFDHLDLSSPHTENDILSDSMNFLLDFDIGVGEKALKRVLDIFSKASRDYKMEATKEIAKLRPKNTSHIQTTESTIRFYDTCVQIGNLNEDSFNYLESKDVYKFLLEDFFGSDILVQLNVAHLVKNMMSSDWGFHFVASRSIGSFLDVMDSIGDFDAMARKEALVIASKIVAKLLSEDSAVENSFVSRILDEINNLQNEPVIVDCLVDLARSNNGLKVVLGSNYGFLGKMWQVFSSPEKASGEFGLQLSAFSFLEESVKTAIECEMFDEIVTRNLEEVPNMLKVFKLRPFPDWRISFYEHFSNSIRDSNFCRKLLGEEYFLENLLNTTSEDNHESILAKYRFILSLFKHHENLLHGFLDSKANETLKKMKENGPFYRENIAGVEVGGQ